jgi:hypothetical protein
MLPIELKLSPQLQVELLYKIASHRAMPTIGFSQIREKVGTIVLAAAILSVTAAIFPTAATGPFQAVYADGNGNQGCTPGYWIQPQHFDSYPAGITPDTQLDVLLGFEIPGYETLTVIQALALQGGGANQLIRQGTAGLLNVYSEEVDYGMSLSTTLRQFQDGLDPQLFDMWPDADNDLELRKDFLDAANNGLGGCPLD